MNVVLACLLSVASDASVGEIVQLYIRGKHLCLKLLYKFVDWLSVLVH